jgi:hypothetical protein
MNMKKGLVNDNENRNYPSQYQEICDMFVLTIKDLEII